MSHFRCFPGQEDVEAEWLLTNQTGSYAMGTVHRVPTRRYHGLWVQALMPPRRRVLLLHSLALDLTHGGSTLPLWSADWTSGDRGPGASGLFSFTLEHGIPHYRWDLGIGTLTESLWTIPGTMGMITQYRWQGVHPVTLTLTPLFRGADHHQLGYRPPDRMDPASDGVTLTWFAHPWQLKLLGSHFTAKPEVFGGYLYHQERDRGYDFQEDLWAPGRLALTFTATCNTGCLTFMDAHHPDPGFNPIQAVNRERERRKTVSFAALRAEHFVARGTEGVERIVAGFPWFSDWGRDALIALPGLAEQLGDSGLITRVLESLLRGGLPIYNQWSDDAEQPDLVSADTNLWFAIRAGQAALQGLLDEPGRYVRAMDQIIDAYLTGQLQGIRVGNDGLVAISSAPHALTWMDAKLGDRVITPRMGQPIEIEALWYNALKIRDALALSLRQPARYPRAAEDVYQAVNRLYPHGQGFRDGVDDDTLRPNQLYAVGLPYAVADPRHWRGILETVTQALYRPYGLLTLPEDHADFHPTYRGSVETRDPAYHQGLAWPFLLGLYLDALSRTQPERLPGILEPIRHWHGIHVHQAGLQSVSEIIEPLTGRPVGAPFQAWSVAELGRVIALPPTP